MASGRDKDVVDPDENLIYTRRKQRQEKLQTRNDPLLKESPVRFPSTGWSTSLQRMPLFTKAEMDLHVSQSGKTIDRSKQSHTVPTSMRKAKTFLEDEYLKDVVAASDNEYFFFQCLCHHSYKKNEAPHKLKVALCLVSGSVKYASCTCVAGSVGFCNHVLALMMKLCKFSLYNCQNVKELDDECDMAQPKACTSSLQLWHRPARGEKIKPQPVMELNVKRSKLDSDYDPDSGVRCLLYEARKNLSTQTSDEVMLKDQLQKINPKFALSQILSPGGSNLQETKFGKSPSGSYASYQLQFSESNFQVFCSIDSVPRADSNDGNHDQNAISAFPAFPLRHSEQYKKPDGLSKDQEALLDHLIVDEAKLNSIEKTTREQAASQEWNAERKFRFTASNFHTIAKRKRNHASLVNNLLHPKPFTSKQTEHGKTYEPVALKEYEKYMFATRNPVTVLKSGLVVSMACPILAASPDGKVIDHSCSKPFGLVEVKCPFSKFHVSPLDACADESFFAENVNGQPRLKRGHQYYFQIQGQLAVTGASWCDFVIYTSKGMSVERITFDPQFWDTLNECLKNCYFNHFIEPAALEFCKH